MYIVKQFQTSSDFVQLTLKTDATLT